jgi:hypothetical protein
MEKKRSPDDVSIEKFDILATYVYAQALLQRLDDDEAKQRGMVAAIMGAQARLGVRKDHHEEFQTQKEAAEKKKKTTITAESFDKQVAHKMREFFNYITDIGAKWRRNYFYFFSIYACPGPNALSPAFDSMFARMEPLGYGKFALYFMRHTGE